MSDGLLAYLSTMFQLVGGALRLDPAAFQAVFNYEGDPTLLLFWIVFIAGLSRMVGQSVVLFANRVKPARFTVSLVLGALSFVLNVLVLVVVVWAMANLLGEKSWNLAQIARAVALATAVFWLSFLVLIPYAGLIWEQLLKAYLFLALVVAIQAVFGITFLGAVLSGLVALLVAQGINMLISRPLTPLVSWITYKMIGPEEIADTREIYQMFARRNLIR